MHGWCGTWLVNGAGTGLVRIVFEPVQRARTADVTVRLCELIVDVDDPPALIAALRDRRPGSVAGRRAACTGHRRT